MWKQVVWLAIHPLWVTGWSFWAICMDYSVYMGESPSIIQYRDPRSIENSQFDLHLEKFPLPLFALSLFQLLNFSERNKRDYNFNKLTSNVKNLQHWILLIYPNIYLIWLYTTLIWGFHTYLDHCQYVWNIISFPKKGLNMAQKQIFAMCKLTLTLAVWPRDKVIMCLCKI